MPSHPFWTRNGERVYYISQAGADGSAVVGGCGRRPAGARARERGASRNRRGGHAPGALARRPGRGAAADVMVVVAAWRRSRSRTAPALRSLADWRRWPRAFQSGWSVAGLDVRRRRHQQRRPVARHRLLSSCRGRSEPVRQILTDLPRATNVPLFDWWPDNRQMVIALPETTGGNRHLWIADTGSGAIRQITSGHTNETAPAVAPDGARIAYASEEVDFDLTLITPDGRTRRTMLATARNEFDPVWSPAGDQFAFVTDRSGSVEIWTRSRDGVWERPDRDGRRLRQLADRHARPRWRFLRMGGRWRINAARKARGTSGSRRSPAARRCA